MALAWRGVARPILILGLLGAAIGIPVNFEYMPRARALNTDSEFTAALRSDPIKLISPKTFIRDFPGIVAYVGEKHASDLTDCWLWKLDKENRVVGISSMQLWSRGEYDEATNELVLTLTQAQVETRNEKNPGDFSDPQPIPTVQLLEPTHLSLERIFGRDHCPTEARLDDLWPT